jgi:hypothetical protein
MITVEFLFVDIDVNELSSRLGGSAYTLGRQLIRSQKYEYHTIEKARSDADMKIRSGFWLSQPDEILITPAAILKVIITK